MDIMMALQNMSSETTVVGVQPREIKNAAGQIGMALDFAAIFGEMVNFQPISADSRVEKQEQKQGELMPAISSLAQGAAPIVMPWVFLVLPSSLPVEEQFNRVFGTATAIDAGIQPVSPGQQASIALESVNRPLLSQNGTITPTLLNATALTKAVDVTFPASLIQTETVTVQGATQQITANTTDLSTYAADMQSGKKFQYIPIQPLDMKKSSQEWPATGKGNEPTDALLQAAGDNIMPVPGELPDDLSRAVQLAAATDSDVGKVVLREFNGEPVVQKQAQLLLSAARPERADNPASVFVGMIDHLNTSPAAPFTSSGNSAPPAHVIHDPYKVVEQVVAQARLRMRPDNSEMVIHLKPEHLGELTLKVSVENGGAVTASFHSNNPEVRSIIEASLPELKQELINQGLKVEYVGVYTGLSQSFMNDQRDQRQHIFTKSGLRKTMRQLSEVAAMETHGAHYVVPAVSGVDYRV
ncbi:hook-length control protein FliK [Sporolituus thermophilus DSM 23256]|uniref:Hook-length control protein FliK n=2 Tax=Sporolituus TaxID=909931 RepID=A0A1G7KP63_9FIRM|nr:hook-length control protein FliK [Sporolituus thermophilus DSM 23256]